MDKYEYQAKLEEINKLVEKEDYDGAVSIADTIEWKRVRSVRTLCMISGIYETVGRAEDSKAILYRAYRRSPNSRQILYCLTEACIQTQDFDDAVEYYTEYVNLSPNDNSKYILKYKIYKGRGSSLEEQIAVLEELKSREYTEQWAYELAKLYDEAGMADKCVAECDDLALWFHNGKYVVQALELKKKYKPLTREQQTIYDNPSEIVDMETKEEVVKKAVPTLDEVITKELPQSEKEVVADSITMDTEKEIAAAVQAIASKEREEEKTEEKETRTTPDRNLNTVDLQNELANSMKEILSGIRSAAPVVELEDLPVMSQIKLSAAEQEEAEQIPGQMNIDDLLTGAAAAKTKEAVQEETTEEKPVSKTETKNSGPEEAEAETDILSAPTINLAQKIHQEIGDTPIREYAASQRTESVAKTAMRRAKDTVKTAAQHVEDTAKTAAQHVEDAARTAAQRAGDTVRTAARRTEDAAVFAKEPAPQPAAYVEKSAPSGQQPAAQQETADAAPDGAAFAAKRQPEYVHETLDEKEKAMLGFWDRIRGMDAQVNAAVTAVMKSVILDKTSSSGNILLVGDAGNGRTTLAISMAKIISRCKGLQVAKVAKIYAEDLNSKDIAATVSKIAGGVLIIEEAGDLSENAVSQLSMAMDFKTDSLVVVLEDEKRYLQDLLARNPKFAQKFTVTVLVPMLTNDELVEFGRYYAQQSGCTLEDTAVTALYDGIGAMQSPEQPVAILDVKEILDKAIKHANRFGLGKLFASLSGKRLDANGRVILKAKNFKKIK